MPNDPGPSSWLAGQYRRFLEGLELTGTANAPRLARAELPVQVEPGKAPRISIPRWDDVFRTGPRTIVTEEDRAIHRHFTRAGLPSPLAPEIQQEIADRRAMAERIRNSAIPEYQRGVATMMTVIDNVQDATLTIAVGARILAGSIGRFGSWVAPAVAGFGTLARMLNWIGLAVGLFGILYALICQGPRDAAAQWRSAAMAGYAFKGLRAINPRLRGMPTPLPAAGAKGSHGTAMFAIPSGRTVSNHRASRWARAMPSFAEILQIGQVAYDHTGYGLALGSIMGFSSETAYAAARLQRGEKTVVRSPEVNHVFARLVGSRVAGLGRGALWHRHQCARALAAAPFVLRDPWSWGDELYGLTWIAVYACLEPLMWDTEGLDWREPVIDHLRGAAWTPWDVADPLTRDLLEELGIARENLVWPIPGSPRELTAERLMVELGKEVGDVLRRWLEEDDVDPWRRFIAEMAMNVTERVWWWAEGANDWPAWKLAPSTAVWESLFLAARWPVISDPPDRLMTAWAASEQYVVDAGKQLIPVDVLDRIWADAGVPLLRLQGPDHPVPAEILAPYDDATGVPGNTAFGHSVAEARSRLASLLEEERRRQARGEPT